MNSLTDSERIDIAKAAKRWRYDKDLGCFIEITEGTNYEPPKKLVGPSNLIRDIDNYQAVGIQDPKAPRGTPLIVTKGRRQHRDELKARGYSEVGNDPNMAGRRHQSPPAAPMVREALARAGYFDSARSLKELRRQGR